MQETKERWVPSLGREDALEKEVAAHCGILAWTVVRTEEPGRLHAVHGVAKSQTRLKPLRMQAHKSSFRPSAVSCRTAQFSGLTVGNDGWRGRKEGGREGGKGWKEGWMEKGKKQERE